MAEDPSRRRSEIAALRTGLDLGLTLIDTAELYAEPFAASGRYYDYGELLEPGSRDRLKYGTAGTTLTINPDGSQTVNAGTSTFHLRNRDFNTLSFRSNVVLRWEYLPGSTFYLVWSQNRVSDELVGEPLGARELLDTFDAPAEDIFSVKASFRLGPG